MFLGEPQSPPSTSRSTTFYRSQSPEDETVLIPASSSGPNTPGQNAPAQFTQMQNGLTDQRQPDSLFFSNDSGIGNSDELNPMIPSNAPMTFPQNYADLDIYVSETQTGRINFGAAYNSDNGLVGQFTIDERNFDLFRLPRNFREIVDGTAWRGAGQNFRLELVPGNEVERYLVSFSEPFLFHHE